jgi:hypothetical protein
MAGRSCRWWLPVAFSALFLLAAGPSRGEEAKLAISGYDPVAYFTDGKPIPGQSQIEYAWHDARWRFSSAAHRDLFARDPDRYAPQYDGYCAMGVSLETEAHKDAVDPQAWVIVNGKLYLAYNRHWLEVFSENIAENIARADGNWPSVKEQPVSYDGYPNNARADKK